MAKLTTGLLWSADAPREAITTTLTNAVARFKERFGCPPDAAYLNEHQYDPVLAAACPELVEGAGIELHPARNVLKNTVFVVKEETYE